jgi:acetylornithine deacetylase/succinyl-diaminopimelate desuccinylase-like protein
MIPERAVTEATAWLERNDAALFHALNEFLAMPSISTQSPHRQDVTRCAEWLAAELRRIGLEAGCHPTPGHPVVLGSWRGAPAAPTVLVYGHYDVQPPEPLDQWTSPPFTGTGRDGRLYARGAADDKGQVWIHIKALEAWMATHGRLPINVVLMIEGEEEVGSPNVPAFLAAHRESLACDYIVISDTMMFAPGVPNILASMRGIAYFEIAVRTAAAELHSGQYGGVVANAAAVLARLLASLHDARGRVAIAGFYEDVQEPLPARRAELASLGFDEAAFASAAGVEALTGEHGVPPLERLWLRPTCETNGMWGGYTGEGSKTVIPASAFAKVSCRLVPNQTPERVERQLRAHLAGLELPGATVEVRPLHGGAAWRARTGTPAVLAARRALTTAFEHEAVNGGTGGTIPIVPELARHFDAEILMIGFGLPGENAHAPNEWIDVETVRRGMRAVVALYQELGALARLK